MADRRKSRLAGQNAHPAWQAGAPEGAPGGGDEPPAVPAEQTDPPADQTPETGGPDHDPPAPEVPDDQVPDEVPDDQVRDDAPVDEEPRRRTRRGSRAALPAPVTRNPRRLRVVGKVSDEDMVSFNCKMSRGLRRQVRHFAADAEVDIQDVVAAALAEYLTARGVDVPAFELRQPG